MSRMGGAANGPEGGHRRLGVRHWVPGALVQWVDVEVAEVAEGGEAEGETAGGTGEEMVGGKEGRAVQ